MVLQDCACFVSIGHGKPPLKAGMLTERDLAEEPVPHDLEHVLQAVQSVSVQFTGQSPTLQNCD